MPIKKPKSTFGLSEAVWLAFVLGFLVVVVAGFSGCKSTGVKPDHSELGDRLNK